MSSVIKMYAEAVYLSTSAGYSRVWAGSHFAKGPEQGAAPPQGSMKTSRLSELRETLLQRHSRSPVCQESQLMSSHLTLLTQNGSSS